jgi:hypothetical protein
MPETTEKPDTGIVVTKNTDGTTSVSFDFGKRTLVVKELDPFDMFDFFEAVGEQVENKLWMGMARIVCAVTMLDGQPIIPPKNKIEIKAMSRRLGHVGIGAAAEGIQAGRAGDGADLTVAKN